jgi:hypothetical protein
LEKSLEARVGLLLDRQEIADAIHRYCRGLDRADRALAISAYHEDAIDDHGVVVLKAADFVDWALAMHAEQHISHTHIIGNITIEIDGDTAHVESYYITFCENKVKPNMLTSGRYVDRFERRNGKWAVAARVCISESLYKVADFDFPPGFIDVVRSNGPAERSRKDVSYERPLKVKRPLRTQQEKM